MAVIRAGLFVGSLLLLLTLGRSRFFGDPGTFWHTVVGQRLLGSGPFRTDPFSAAHFGGPWLPHQWLGEVAMALLHRATGLDGLLLASAALLAAVFALIGGRLRRSGMHPALVVAVAAVCFATASPHFLARPHLATMGALSLTFALMCDVEAGRAPPTRMWWLPPLFVLWANVHGGVLGGLGTLTLGVVGWTLGGVTRGDGPLVDTRARLHAWGSLTACALSPLVNPWGAALPAAWLSIMGSDVIPAVIVEHGSVLRTGAWQIAAGGIALLAMGLPRPPAAPRVTWLLALVWLALAFDRVRHGPLLAIVAALALAEAWADSRLRAAMAARGSRLFVLHPPGRESPRLRAGALAVSLLPLVLAAALQLGGIRAPLLGAGWARLSPDDWPVGLAPALRAQSARLPRGTAVLNDYKLGGFLIFHAPRLRVSVDDRCELYGDRELLQQLRAAPDYLLRWERRHRPRLALSLPGSALDRYLSRSQEWVPVAQERAGRLYRRLPE